jgi:hypothetical protein
VRHLWHCQVGFNIAWDCSTWDVRLPRVQL